MQYPYTQSRSQLPLFDGFMAHNLAPFATPPAHSRESGQDGLSELHLQGSRRRCQLLLAPILRDLSEAPDTRWLTLIAPPASLTQAWLRASGLNRERILLLQPSHGQSAFELACKALAAGCSHTVISWLDRLDSTARFKLRAAADMGTAQSLNIQLG